MATSIKYVTHSPALEVNFTARTAEAAPEAWAVVDVEDGRRKYESDLHDAHSSLPLLVKTAKVSGLAADVVADMWDRYTTLRSAVAAAEGPVERWATVDRWSEWASGKLALRGAVEAPASTQRQWLLTEIASQKTVLTALSQRDGTTAALHPVAAAMQSFMYGQEQLDGLNGSTPDKELLPAAAYANPVEIVGMVALDLAMMPELELVEA